MKDEHLSKQHPNKGKMNVARVFYFHNWYQQTARHRPTLN